MKLYKLFSTPKILSISFIVLTSSLARATDEWNYKPIQELGENCYNSFGKDQFLGKSLVGQTFVLDSTSSSKSSSINPLSLRNIPDQDAWDLVLNTNQMQLNETIYHFRVFKKMYNQKDQLIQKLSESKDPQVKQALKISSALFDSQKNIEIIATPESVQKQIQITNGLNKQINRICSLRHQTYAKLKKAYDMQAYEYPQFLTPEVKQLMRLDPSKKISMADMYLLFVRRMQEEKEAGLLETSIYRTISSLTPFSFFLETDTDLQHQVGKFDADACVEEGAQLKMIPSSTQINSSIRQVQNKYKETLERLSPPRTFGYFASVFFNRAPYASELLRKDLQENPTSVRNALLNHPNLSQAKYACSVIHGIQSDYEMKKITWPIEVIGSYIATVASGPFAPVVGSAFCLMYAGQSIQDILHSNEMETNIEQALLSNQIPSLDGQQIITNLQNQRALSYINLVLAGLGATHGALSIAELTSIHPPTGATGLPKTTENFEFPQTPYQKSSPISAPKGSGGVGVLTKPVTTPKTYSGMNELLEGTGVTKSVQSTSTTSSFSNTTKLAPLTQTNKAQAEQPKNIQNKHADVENDKQEILESDFVRLQRALSGLPEYQSWLENEAKNCEAGESKFSDEICDLITTVVSGKYEDKAGFAIAFNNKEFSSDRESLLKDLQSDHLKYITLRLKNGKLIVFLLPKALKNHESFYEMIIQQWGEMEFVAAGFIANYKYMLIPGAGSVESYLGIEQVKIPKEIQQQIKEIAAEYFTP